MSKVPMYGGAQQRGVEVGTERRAHHVPGYLAHKKQPPPLGPPYDPMYSPTAGSYEGGVSYERGTPVFVKRREKASSLHERAHHLKA